MSAAANKYLFRVRVTGICALLIFTAVAVHARTLTPLAKARTAKCAFTLLATGNWQARGETEAEIKKATIVMTFDNINVDEGTARVAGPFGYSDIVVRQAGEYLHFIQAFAAGPVYLTTIINRVTHDDKLKAVHTRHEYVDVALIDYTSRPEQYYGECEVE